MFDYMTTFTGSRLEDHAQATAKLDRVGQLMYGLASVVTLARHGRGLGAAAAGDDYSDYATRYPVNVRSTYDIFNFAYEMMFTFLQEMVETDETT